MAVVVVSAGQKRARHLKASLFVTPDPSDPGLFVVGADDARSNDSIPVIPTLKAHRYWTIAASPADASLSDEEEFEGSYRRHPSRRHGDTRD
jgi:hypothetical protein